MSSINPKGDLYFHSRRGLPFNPLAPQVGVFQGEVHYWQGGVPCVINDPGYGPVSNGELHPSHFMEASHTIYCLKPGCVPLQLGKCLPRRMHADSSISAPVPLSNNQWADKVWESQRGTEGDRVRCYFMPSTACGNFCLLPATSFQGHIHPTDSINIMAFKSIWRK